MSAETKTTPIPGLSPTKCNVVVISTANAEPSVLASNVECPQTSTSAAGTGGSNTVQIQTGTTPLAGQTTNTTPSQQPTTVTNNATGGNVHPVASSGITSSVQAATESSVATTSAAFTIEISKPTLLPINGTLNNTLVVPHSDAQKGLTGGAVAGVAIGMLLAGVIIAGAVFLVLLRRQKKQQAISAAAYSRQHAPYNDRSVRPEKGPTVVAAPVGSIENLLPQPAEDDAITGQLSKIRDNIKNHVRTYYHSGPITSADLNDASIRDVAALTGSSPAILVNALSNPSTRDNALRAIVGSVILTRCTGERTPSLLPTELAAISATIQVDSGNNPQSVLISKWKAVTGALLQQRYGKQSQDPSRAQSFQDTVVALDSILAQFITGSVDVGQRRKNLDMILTRAANFAFLLFAQPGTFRFDFASRQGDLTVFPALVQTVDDHGRLLSSVKVLADKEVVAA